MREYRSLYTCDQRAQTKREKGKKNKRIRRKDMETGIASRRERIGGGEISPMIKEVIHEQRIWRSVRREEGNYCWKV